MSGPEGPRPGAGWEDFRAARERFLARVRPEAMENPPGAICADEAPAEWPADRGEAEQPVGE